jgi:hypothetical protein
MSPRLALRLTTCALVAIFAVYAAMVVSDLLNASRESAPYFIGDWQINYSAGFVRRGLLGELAYLLYTNFAIDTRTTVVVMQVLAHIVFLVASIALLAPVLVRHPMFAFAVFSPMTMAFAALDSGFGTSGLNTTGAKDVVFLASLAVQGALTVSPRTDPAASRGRLLAVALLWGVLVLIHEGFFFFLPFSVALLFLSPRTRITLPQLALMFVPPLLAFGLAAVFHGDPATGRAICASLGAGAPAGCEKTGAVVWLTNPAMTYIKGTYYMITQPPYILLATAQAAMLGAVGFAFLALDRRAAQWTREALQNREMLLIAIACCVTPLPAFLASDHGRFLHIWFTSILIVMAVFLSRRSRDEEAATPAAAAHAPAQTGALARVLWLFVFVTYAITWSARGPCCPEGLGSGFLGRIFIPFAQTL